MDTKHALVAKLSDALKPSWAQLSPETKEAVKAVMADINVDLLSLADTQAAMTQAHVALEGVTPDFRSVVLIDVYNPAGEVVLKHTLRDHTDALIAARAMALLARYGIKIEGEWVSLDKKIDTRNAARSSQQPAQPSRPATATAPGAPQPAAGGGSAGSPGEVFTAAAITLTPTPKSLTDPALMWGVKTAVSNYVVRMYADSATEAFKALGDAGIDMSVLAQPNGQLVTYDLAGWTAHYTKDKNNKYPGKIVNLTR